MANIKYTDHAYERMYLRGISKSLIRSALEDHHELIHEDDGDTRFVKNVKRGSIQRELHVVAKPLPREGKDTWLIKTVWIRGEDDPNRIIKAVRMLMMRFFFRKP